MESTDFAAWQANDQQRFSRHLLGQATQYATIFMEDAGVITGWSRGAHFITGFTAADALGQPFALIFTPEDRELRLDQHEINSAATIGFFEDERWHQRQDSSRFWASGFTMKLAGGGFVKVMRDATHLRARTVALQNLLDEQSAQQASSARSFAQVVHDLRNPIAPIKTATLLLRRSNRPDIHARALDTIERQLGVLERLSTDLFDATRVAHGRLSIALQRFNLQPLVQAAVDEMAPAAEQHGVRLTCVLPEALLEVELDPERLQQVLANLMGNAIKFTPAGGDVAVIVTFDGSHMFITVKDNGIGIGPELQPRIFELFTQASTPMQHEGLGIGLAIVKEIAALHGGTVEVRSDGPGKGSEFLIRMPIRQRVDAGQAPDVLDLASAPPDDQPQSERPREPGD